MTKRFHVNDQTDSSTLTVHICEYRKSCLSPPVNINFERYDEKSKFDFSFNMSASEAERMALYILEQIK